MISVMYTNDVSKGDFSPHELKNRIFLSQIWDGSNVAKKGIYAASDTTLQNLNYD